jgi:hypothetical protein
MEQNAMDKEYLESLVEQGLSTNQLAKIFKKGQTTIMYWLKKFGLKTKHRSFKDIPLEEKIDKNNQYCDICNIKLNDNNAYIRNEKNRCCYHNYCKKCFSKDNFLKKLNFKKKALEYKNSCCEFCGYDKDITALDFHHLDPSQKEISPSNLHYKSWDYAKQELDKCIVLCSNCHREEHFRLDNKKQLEKEFSKFNVSSLTSFINTGVNTGNPSCKKCDVVLSNENIASKKHYPICKSCNSARAMKREKDGKKQAVEYMGGCCSTCGYDRCIRALEFHHLEPDKKTKDFEKRFKVWSFERQKKELENCIIVCSNCHREIHSKEEHKTP